MMHVFLMTRVSISPVKPKEYENSFLTQEIQFLEFIQDYFALNRLRHVQKIYDDRLRDFNSGDEITVMAYYNGSLEQHRIRSKK